MAKAQRLAVLRQLPAAVDLTAFVVDKRDACGKILFVVERRIKGQHQRGRAVQLQLGEVDNRERFRRRLRRGRLCCGRHKGTAAQQRCAQRDASEQTFDNSFHGKSLARPGWVNFAAQFHRKPAILAMPPLR